MIRIAHISVCLVCLCLAVIAPVNVAQAGDEDLTSSVYLVFDPETGEFLEVNDQKRTLQDHEAREPADTALAHGASSSWSVLPPKLSPWVGFAIAAALLVAIIAWRRVLSIRSARAAARSREP